MHKQLIPLLLIWYATSIGLSIYNKWMFDPVNGIGLENPILITAIHQSTLYVVSSLYLRCTHSTYTRPNTQFYMSYLLPTALSSAGDCGFGNASFKYLPIAIYIITKSTSIPFTLLFGFVFRTEPFSWELVMIIGSIFIGVVMMVYKPVDKESRVAYSKLVYGSMLAMMGGCSSGLRWVYTHRMLKVETKSKLPQQDPIALVNLLSPLMAIALFLVSFASGPSIINLFQSELFKNNDEYTPLSIVYGTFLLLVPGCAVMVFTLCQYKIIQISSLLTMSISGVVKEVLLILYVVIIEKDDISGIYNVVGVVLVLVGLMHYNYFRYMQGKRNEQARRNSNIELKLMNGDAFEENPSQDSSQDEFTPYSTQHRRSKDVLALLRKKLGFE